jgi:hypothetical protein
VQSCDVANASGSTGIPFDPKKIGNIKEVTAAGARCIEQNYYKMGMPFPKGYTPKSSPPKGYSAKTYFIQEPRQSGVSQMRSDSLEKRQQSCKQHTLVWARGTMEPATNGGIGFMLGKSILNELSSSQPGKWNGVGVKYNPDFAGIYCVGLPGGLNCVDQITALNAKCPSTKFIVGGFSQGAMVAHNCVAFAPAKVKKQIAVSHLRILPGVSKCS